MIKILKDPLFLALLGIVFLATRVVLFAIQLSDQAPPELAVTIYKDLAHVYIGLLLGVLLYLPVKTKPKEIPYPKNCYSELRQLFFMLIALETVLGGVTLCLL